MRLRHLAFVAALVIVSVMLAGCSLVATPVPGASTTPAPASVTPLATGGREPSPTPAASATAGGATTATLPAPSATPAPTRAAPPGTTPTPRPTAGTPSARNNGMVILAFADSAEGAYTVAYQAMRAHGVAGVAYVVVQPIEQRQPGRLTPEQLDELNAAGWDIASHGYNHDDPTQLTAQQLSQSLQEARDWLLGRGYTRGARHYGPPSNNCDQRVLDEALLYYDTVWCREYSKLPAGYDFGVGACGNNTSWERLQVAFDKLVGQPNRVLRCTFHGLVPQNPVNNQADLERVNAILDYLETKDIDVVTLSGLLDGTLPNK